MKTHTEDEEIINFAVNGWFKTQRKVLEYNNLTTYGLTSHYDELKTLCDYE